MENNQLPAVAQLPLPGLVNPSFWGNYWEHPNYSGIFYAADCPACGGGGEMLYEVGDARTVFDTCSNCQGSGIMPAPGCPDSVAAAILRDNAYDEDALGDD